MLYCNKTKQAKLSYSFGSGQAPRLYLVRNCPFEVKVHEGTPSNHPPFSSISGIFTLTPWLYGYDPSCVIIAASYWDIGWLNDMFGIRWWGPILDRENRLMGYRSRDIWPFATQGVDNGVRPTKVDERPYTVDGKPIQAPVSIEVWYEGKLIFSDYGPAPCNYSVRCGNGCDEDRELTVTEVSSYPGIWCFTDAEMQRLSQDGKALAAMRKRIDNSALRLKKLNDDIDNNNRRNETPEDKALDEALEQYIDELDEQIEELQPSGNASGNDPRIEDINKLKDLVMRAAQSGSDELPSLLSDLNNAVNALFGNGPTIQSPSIFEPKPAQGGVVEPGSGQGGVVQPGSGQGGVVQPGSGQGGIQDPTIVNPTIVGGNP